MEKSLTILPPLLPHYFRRPVPLHLRPVAATPHFPIFSRLRGPTVWLRVFSIYSRPCRMVSTSNNEKARKPTSRRHRYERFLLRDDYRGRLPRWISRFTGYRQPGDEPPYDPLPFPPFNWLVKIPLRVEVWIFAWIGCFGGILLIEAIMCTNTAFRNVYSSPIIITSFGASAVLLFGAIESPLAQPRNFIGGHFVSALLGTAITRLWVLNPRYQDYLDNTGFHGNTFVNGGLCMATAALAMLISGMVHPPSGATTLNAAVQTSVVSLFWRYLPVVLASALIMQGWALIINNLGRRRYPIYWWSPKQVFVRPEVLEHENDEETALRTLQEGPLRSAEDAGRTRETLLEARMQGEGAGGADFMQDPSGQNNIPMGAVESPEIGVPEPRLKPMTEGDRRRAEGFD
ncbi:HPP family protein [Cryptococcus neoformans var. grubii Br795]|nr:HPP family protein [Cryptococcus neoformans var. grubii Br795]